METPKAQQQISQELSYLIRSVDETPQESQSRKDSELILDLDLDIANERARVEPVIREIQIQVHDEKELQRSQPGQVLLSTVEQ